MQGGNKSTTAKLEAMYSVYLVMFLLVLLQFRGLHTVNDKFSNIAFMMCCDSQQGEEGK